jgi:uncharacterized protein YbjT (DUF2867 family)
MAKILIFGATGYIGGRLVPRLLERGHQLRLLVRDPRKVSGKGWKDVEVLEGDILRPETLPPAFKDIDYVYYLVHSMSGSASNFEKQDRSAAWNIVTLCQINNVKRVIYLGGLGKRNGSQSPHLRSRHEVGDILRAGNVPVTEFRAAVIIGSGSVSFEMIHHLVNRLPVMICPRWVGVRTQPIGIRDVIRYLYESIEKPHTSGKIYDIGGPDILTYGDMMTTVADVLGLKRLLIPVPLLTPRLSSLWVNLVTPVPSQLARILIESLRHETVCESDEALRDFGFSPMDFKSAVKLALERARKHEVETVWTAASLQHEKPYIDPSHLREDIRIVDADVSPDVLFSVVSSLGGSKGWLYANRLWQIRGFIDKQLGGVGLRRGRRHPDQLIAGDALDFWRVEEYIQNKKIVLRAEMKVWGNAWLEFLIEPQGPYTSKLTQTARYYPRGLTGFIYWYLIYPIHIFVFRGMARAIVKEAERIHNHSLYAA